MTPQAILLTIACVCVAVLWGLWGARRVEAVTGMTAPGRWAVTGIAAPLGLLAGVVARPTVLALALVPLAGASAVLSLTDQRWCRLPDRVVGPAYLCVTAGLVASAVVADDYAALGRSAAAGAVAALVYVAIRLIRPASIGFGDVKLVPVLAMVLGWSGWFDVFLGWALASPPPES